MPFRRPRVWAGGKPAIPMRACAGVVHASGSRRLGYPMTTFARPQAGPGAGTGGSRKGSLLASWLSTTDHKIIGHLYLITSFGFFLIAGLMAMIMRAQLFGPDNHIVSDQQYNELFTMHGTIMLLLFATPLFVGFANEIMPLQIGAPDVAFPRLNILSYYFFVFGGLILLISFLTPGGAAAFGWYAYSPLTSQVYSPGIGSDLWIMGLVLSGLGTILSGVNFVTTIICMRAPGMTMFRMPIFTWNVLVTSVMVLIAFPVLAAALLVLEIDRKLGAQVFAASSGGAIMWQHLFWFFGHPEVYIVAIPFFGIATEVIPVFSRKPLFGYKGMVGATLAIAGPVHDGVGAPHVHHRRGAAAVLLVHDVPDRGAHRDQVLQLGGHHVARPAHLRAGDAVRHRVPGLIPARRADRGDPGLAAAGLPRQRLLLHGRPLPLRAVRHGGVHHVRRVLLLVAQVHREDAGQHAGQVALLDAVHRLLDDVPGPSLARASRACPAGSPTTRSCPAT